jgi:hypothetical protein
MSAHTSDDFSMTLLTRLSFCVHILNVRCGTLTI